MLRQILNDMYVDPEILSGLDEYQKQTLFCKMREEQIRRWRIREQQSDNGRPTATSTNKSKKKKNVSFREDDEGELWVIVIEPAIYTDCCDSDDNDNNNKNDLLTNEAKQRARELAEIETKELRRQYKAELSEIITDYDNNKKEKALVDADPLGSPIIDDLEIYCSVDELRERMAQSKALTSSSPTSIAKNFKQNNSRIINFSLSENQNEKNAILKEISNNKPIQKVSAKIALWEQRVIGEKTNEIYLRLKKKQQEAAEEEAKKQEEAWKEQERKAKEADIQYREIARRAREEHRKSLNTEQTNGNVEVPIKQNGVNGKRAQAPAAPVSPSMNNTAQSSPPSSLDSLIPRPQSQEAMIEWYHNIEMNKGAGLETMASRRPCKWFHGLLTRADAEQLLDNEPMGTFLVRLSEKIWGYAISYKDVDRCKHYLINASSGQYKFLGANQINHDRLSEFKCPHTQNLPMECRAQMIFIIFSLFFVAFR